MGKTDLTKLKPLLVWRIFEGITKIPRCSKKEEKIRDWVKEWVKNNDITFKEDEVGNILLTKAS